MKQNIYQHLIKNDLFKNIPLKKIKTLSISMFQMVKFQDKDIIIKQHSNSDGMYLIISGTVLISKKSLKQNNTAQSQNVMINRCESGEIVGELSIISNNKRAADVIAIHEVETIFISTENFNIIRKTIPEVGFNIERIIANRLGQTAIQVASEKNKYMQLSKIQKELEQNINFSKAHLNQQNIYKQIQYIITKLFEDCNSSFKNIEHISKELNTQDLSFAKTQLALDLKRLRAIFRNYIDVIDKKKNEVSSKYKK